MINGKHVRPRNPLLRMLSLRMTMAATVEEVCFEVNRNKMPTVKRNKLLAAEFTVIRKMRWIR